MFCARKATMDDPLSKDDPPKLLEWTHRNAITGEAESSCCANCKYIVSKSFALRRWPAYKTRSEFIVAVRVEAEVRQDHATALQNYIRMKLSGQRVDDAFMPQIISRKATCVLQVRSPDLDLIPDAVLFSKFKKKAAQLGFATTTIQQTNGNELTGVLIYAENWNPPPGCYRMLRALLFIRSENIEQ